MPLKSSRTERVVGAQQSQNPFPLTVCLLLGNQFGVNFGFYLVLPYWRHT